LGLGVVVLMRLNIPRKKYYKEPLQLETGIEVTGELSTGELMKQLIEGDGKQLNKQEARKWVDDFLIKQQDK
jgi:hypothetical protein